MIDSVDFSRKYPVLCAVALAFGAAVALGISRFAYTMFLPLMKEDLHWSYFISGNMNTANAIGYFIGALTCNYLFKKSSLSRVFIAFTWLTIALIAASGLSTDARVIFLIRFLVGITCTYVFVSGGVLAAKIGVQHPKQSGWILGIYYGGVGFGVVLSSIFINPFNDWASGQGYSHPWQQAWYGMAILSTLLGIFSFIPTRTLQFSTDTPHANQRISMRQILPMWISYLLYGLGYIGYMTFSVALVKEIGFRGSKLGLFYGLVGLFMMISSKIWSRQLDRQKGGFVLGAVCLVLGTASLIPSGFALLGDSQHVTVFQIGLIFFSAMLFGSSMVTAVASTTAFVKHNFPQEDWTYGIRIFTIAFALGQIIGPFIVGYISDHSGGLGIGLLFSAAILFIACFIGFLQKPISQLSSTP
jgi:predicted MFS family arabinose efflux permease